MASAFLDFPVAECGKVGLLGRTTADIVLALREGRLASIDLGAIDGIISFPSLHAAVAVIVPFTLRWNRPLFWPIVLLDGVMLVSAVPSGNHYLADVVGGLAVAALAILCARPLHATLDRLFTGRRLRMMETHHRSPESERVAAAAITERSLLIDEGILLSG